MKSLYQQVGSKTLKIFKGKNNLDIVLLLIFVFLQPFIGGNSKYFIVLLVLFLALLFVYGNVLYSLWFVFLSSLPFSRGVYIENVVIDFRKWEGGYDLVSTNSFLFSDFIVVIISYLLITRLWKDRIKIVGYKYDKWIFLSLILFLISSFFSSYFSYFYNTAFETYIQILKFVAVFFISRIILLDKIMVNKTMKIFLVLIILNSLLIVIQYLIKSPFGANAIYFADVYGTYGLYSTEDPTLYRPGGFSADPNVSAVMSLMAFPAILIHLLSNKFSKKLVPFLSFVLILVSILITASRVVWALVIVLAVAIYTFLRRGGLSIKIGQYKKLLFSTFFLLLIVFYPLLASRISTIFGIFGPEGGMTYRLNQIRMASRYFHSRPLGVGLGVFRYETALDFPPQESGISPANPHNIMAQLVSEVGVFGSLIFSVFLVSLIKQKVFLIKGDSVNMATFFAFLCFVASMFFFPWFLHPFMGAVFWILAGYTTYKPVKSV